MSQAAGASGYQAVWRDGKQVWDHPEVRMWQWGAEATDWSPTGRRKTKRANKPTTVFKVLE